MAVLTQTRLKQIIAEEIQRALREGLTPAQEEEYKKLKDAVYDAEDAYSEADNEAEVRWRKQGHVGQHHKQPKYVQSKIDALHKAEEALDAFVKKHRISQKRQREG